MCTFLLTYNDLDHDRNTKHDDNICICAMKFGYSITMAKYSSLRG